MKNTLSFILILIIISIISSCKDPVIVKSESDLVDLLKSDKISKVKMDNSEYAFVYLKNTPERPSFKVKVNSPLKFSSTMSDLQSDHSFQLSNQTFSVVKPRISTLISVYLLSIFIYILGGIICLIVILKNSFKNPVDKVAWIITIIFAPVVGIILFLFIGIKQIDRGIKNKP